MKKTDVFICDQYHVDNDSIYTVSRPINGTCSGVAMVWKNDPKPFLQEFLEVVNNCKD